MKQVDEHGDTDLLPGIIERIKGISHKDIRLMDLVGIHTTTIFRSGIQDLLPANIRLLFGPACPVCVTPQEEIDAFIQLARVRNVIVAVFEDLLRVPGTTSSLQEERSEGKDIRIIDSTLEAIELARQNPKKEVVLPGVGFEAAAPILAATILEAKKGRLRNFSVFSAYRLVPPVLSALMEAKDVKIDGVICPGNVSAVIGSRAYLPIVKKHHLPCVISGFEPADIMQSIFMLTEQIEAGDARLENESRKAVLVEGNEKAKKVMYRVFEPCDATWRGIGSIPESGLAISTAFAAFDARTRFDLPVSDSKEPAGCACGEIVMGIKTPPECPLYKKTCTPDHPMGPCMVSREGTCLACYNG